MPCSSTRLPARLRVFISRATTWSSRPASSSPLAGERRIGNGFPPPVRRYTASSTRQCRWASRLARNLDPRPRVAASLRRAVGAGVRRDLKSEPGDRPGFRSSIRSIAGETGLGLTRAETWSVPDFRRPGPRLSVCWWRPARVAGLFRLDARVARHLRPARKLGAHQRLKRLRRTADRLGAEQRQTRSHLVRGERLHGLRVQARDHR